MKKILLIFAFFSIYLSLNANTINFTTSSTGWKCFQGTPDPNWNAVNYTPNSSWATPTNITIDPLCGYPANPLINTQRIWASNPASLQTTFFRYEFNLDGKGSLALDLKVFADDAVTVFLNGVVIGTSTTAGSLLTINLNTANVAENLRCGKNVFSFRVADTQEYCWFLAASGSITGNSILTAPITAPQQVCSGSMAQLITSGGGSYLWSNDATTNSITVSQNLAGTYAYSVTVTPPNGCKAIANTTVTVLPVPIVTINPVDVEICSGGNAILNASGAVSYVWNTGSTSSGISVYPTTTTTYFVTGTASNGCTGGSYTNVTVIPGPIVTIDGEVAMCDGDPVKLKANAIKCGSFQYQWSANAGSATTQSVVVYSAGTYYCTVTCGDTGCSTVASYVVDPTFGLDINLNNLNVSCDGQTSVVNIDITVMGGIGNLIYEWNNGTSNEDLTDARDGFSEYCVTVTDDKTGCRKVRCFSCLDICGTNTGKNNNDKAVKLPIKKNKKEVITSDKISVFPNPTTNEVNVQINDKDLENTVIRITNQLGEVIEDKKTDSNLVKLDTSNIPNGVYFISLMKEGRNIATSKVIKQ